MSFVYEKPKSLGEAIAAYAMHSGACPILAGGTDLVVQWRSGVIKLKGVIDVSSLSELKTISVNDDFIEIGAAATHSEIISSEVVNKFIPILATACKTIGAIQIQNRGTIGGNIMNASPAGDTLPVLSACNAELYVENLVGGRWISIHDFYTGYRKTSLRKGEILTKIKFPKIPKDEKVRFYKIGTRRALAISKVAMCVRAKIDHGGIEDIAIALGSVAPTVVRVKGTEALLKGKVITKILIDYARRSLEDEIHPIDDVRSTADYRRHVCGSLIARYLSRILQ